MVRFAGHDPELIGQEGDPRECRGQDDDHPGQGRARVLPLRRLKRGHTVRDGLDAGQRRAAAAEGRQDEQDADRLSRGFDFARGDHRSLRHETLRCGADQTERDHADDADQEEVGRHGEDAARFPNPAQVEQRHQDDESQTERDPMVAELRHRRGQRGHAGGDADRHGDDVAEQERGAGGQGRQLPKVVLGHDVGAAARRVRLDRLPVGDADDQEQGDDAHPDWQAQRKRPQPGQEQDVQDLLRGVGHRGEGIRREDR